MERNGTERIERSRAEVRVRCYGLLVAAWHAPFLTVVVGLRIGSLLFRTFLLAHSGAKKRNKEASLSHSLFLLSSSLVKDDNDD